MSLAQSIFGDVPSSSGKSSLFDSSRVEQSQSIATSSAQKQIKPQKKDSQNKNDDDSSSSSSDNSSDDSSNENEINSNSNSNEHDKKDTKNTEHETEKLDNKTLPAPVVNTQDEPIESTPETPKDSEDDAEERTVFVGNLPLSTTRRSLTKLFSECGKVLTTRFRSVAVTGVKVPQDRAGDQNLVKKVCTNTKQLDVDAKSSLQAYVVFADKASVPKAMEQLNNRPLQDDDPHAKRAIRRIRVDTATPTLDPKRSVFVGNLPYHADEASLHDHFVQGCGLEIDDIRGVRIIRDKDTFQCKGFGYVLFQDSTMVATALQKMHDSIYMKRTLRVKVCGKSLKGRRGESKPNNKNNNNKRPNNYATSEHHPPATKKQRTSLSAVVMESGAMRRVAKKNKRKRGEKKKPHAQKAGVQQTPGVSKRAATDKKTDQRVKKLQKRISKGMGKARK